MNLQLLAPDIQEALLFLSPIERGRDQLKLSELQKVALEADWGRQRKRLLKCRQRLDCWSVARARAPGSGSYVTLVRGHSY